MKTVFNGGSNVNVAKSINGMQYKQIDTIYFNCLTWYLIDILCKKFEHVPVSNKLSKKFAASI